MKKAMLIVLSVLITVAFVTTGFAATKAKTEKSVTLTGEVVKNDGKEMKDAGRTRFRQGVFLNASANSGSTISMETLPSI